MTLFDEIQHMVDESLARPHFGQGSLRAYSDITTTDDEVVLTVELPGVDKKDINIDATEESISVSVETEKKDEVSKEGYYKAGSRYFQFDSTYSMPVAIDPNSVRASYTNGVLEIKAKKARPEKKGVNVEVK